MVEMIERINALGPDHIQDVLQAVLARYRVLYPDWELSVISLEKDRDKTAQLNRIIAALESMKQV